MNLFVVYLLNIVLIYTTILSAHTSQPIHQAFKLPLNNTLYGTVKEQYLKSFKIESSLKTDLSSLVIAEKLKISQISLVFDLFSRYERTIEQFAPRLVMPAASGEDLNLFCGNRSKPKHTLLNQLNRTKTLMGLTFFSRLLMQPIDDIETLTQRQEIIYTLLDNQAIYQQFCSLMSDIAKVEPNFLALWLSNEQVGTNVKEANLFYHPEFYHKYSKHAGRFFENCNNNPKFLTLKAHALKLGLVAIVSGLVVQGLAWKSDLYEDLNIVKGKFHQSIETLSRNKKIFKWGKSAFSLLAPAYMALTIWNTTETFPRQNKEVNDAFKNSKIRLDAIKTIFQSVEKFTQLIQTLPTLQKNLKYVHHLFKLMETKELPDKCTHLKLILEELEAGQNNGLNISEKIFHGGKVLLAYRLLDEIKDNFITTMLAIGELDAYLSAATLFQEHAHRKNRYSFVTFFKSDKPYLHLNQFWNPYLPTKDPILNDVELGAPGKARNLMISGPNAGGKSTYLKGTILATVIAQTFGIAPAEGVKMTPFSCLDIYKDIVDDAASQKSLFRAEVFRVKTLIDQTKSLNKDQFSLIVSDEMFSGTNPLDATDLNRAVAEEVATIENSIWMISTHFYDVTKVEQDTHGIFKNSKVLIARHNDGTFSHYTFKVKDGITQDSTALDVLKMENIETSIIDRAEQLKRERTKKLRLKEVDA